METDDNVLGIKQLPCLPEVKLNNVNSTKRYLCCCLVEFLVLNSIYLKIIVPSDAKNRVSLILFNPSMVLVICDLIYEKNVKLVRFLSDKHTKISQKIKF